MSRVATETTARKRPAADRASRRGRNQEPTITPEPAEVQAPDPTVDRRTEAQLLCYVLGFEAGNAAPIRDCAAEVWSLHDAAEAMDPAQLQRVTFALARRLEAIAVLLEWDDELERDVSRAVAP